MAATQQATWVRAGLSFNRSSGLLRTLYQVHELRATLPEHRLGCGFWSNCSSVRTVLPKPCWGKIAANATACGDGEPTVQAQLAKYADESMWPGYRNFVLTPSGVASAPTVHVSGKTQLCMQPWRGMMQPGKAVTFYRCPQQRTRAKQRRWASSHRWSGGTSIV